MYVCMYVCMYARMYVCMYACMYVCMSGMHGSMYGRMLIETMSHQTHMQPICHAHIDMEWPSFFFQGLPIVGPAHVVLRWSQAASAQRPRVASLASSKVAMAKPHAANSTWFIGLIGATWLCALGRVLLGHLRQGELPLLIRICHVRTTPCTLLL